MLFEKFENKTPSKITRYTVGEYNTMDIVASYKLQLL